ncbi:MAG: LURP-one-related family protein [Turicibacter sp.]|nr:LURP-one-related family protein [Turicibacter sp.]
MSQLKVTQKLLSFGDKFKVHDLQDRIRYQVSEKLFTWGKVYVISDESGRELAKIEQKMLSFLPAFYITLNGKPVATIKKELSFLRSSYRIEGANISCTGDFFGMNFQIFEGRQQIAEVNKKFFTMRDTYLIDVPDNSHELKVLALVLAIDICEHSGKKG